MSTVMKDWSNPDNKRFFKKQTKRCARRALKQSDEQYSQKGGYRKNKVTHALFWK